MKSNRAFEILSTLSYEPCYCEVDESIIDYSNAVRAVEEAENEVIDLQGKYISEISKWVYKRYYKDYT